MKINLRSPYSNKRLEVTIKDPKDACEDAIKLFEKPDTETSIKEEVLRRVFLTKKGLGDISSILQKCTLLNIYYTTQIKDKDLFALAKRIQKLNSIIYHDMGMIDYYLYYEEDPQKYRALVNLIAYYTKEDTVGNCYSFASKFCSWHSPKRFPIVDSYAKGLLYRITEERTAKKLEECEKEYMENLYRKMPGNTIRQKQSNLYNYGLNDYLVYSELYENVKHDKDFGLSDLEYKKIDEYIWQYSVSLFDESSDYHILDQVLKEKDENNIAILCEAEKKKTKERRTDEKVRKDYIDQYFISAFRIASNYSNAETILQKSIDTLGVDIPEEK